MATCLSTRYPWHDSPSFAAFFNEPLNNYKYRHCEPSTAVITGLTRNDGYRVIQTFLNSTNHKSEKHNAGYLPCLSIKYAPTAQ